MVTLCDACQRLMSSTLLFNLPKKSTGRSIQQGYEMKLGGGFKYLLFSPLLGDDSHFD